MQFVDLRVRKVHKQYRSEGDGLPDFGKLRKVGSNVVIEAGVRIFHPENIEIGDNVYIGHDTILKGYYNSDIIVGSNVWIGQGCFIHGAGGIVIQSNVGIGPHVKIHAAYHEDDGETLIMVQPLKFSSICIEEDVNVGIGATLMHGVTLRRGTKVGASAVVTKTFPERAVIAGVPARLLRIRP
jgi:acetyltransferase-like isoleucine patch superfamily enzyme